LSIATDDLFRLTANGLERGVDVSLALGKLMGLTRARAVSMPRGMSNWEQGKGMAVIRGFDVSYPHRGSWVATVRRNGRSYGDVPVAWKSDYIPRPPEKPTLAVWFKRPEDVATRLGSGMPFAVALAVRNSDGSSGSGNIINLFEVKPIGQGVEPRQILCVVERAWTPEKNFNAPRS
jgi:hypothetical protein